MPDFFDLYRSSVYPHVTSYGDSDRAIRPWTLSSKVGYYNKEWEPIRALPPADLFPDAIFAKSKYREGGYAMWDFIVRNAKTNMRESASEEKASKVDKLKAAKGETNKRWLDYISARYLTQTDDDTGYVIDMVSEPNLGERILDMAHALAHYRMDKNVPRTDYWSKYMYTTNEFLKAVAELSFAKASLLPVDLMAVGDGGIFPYGIKVFYSTRVGFSVRKPYLQVPYNPKARCDTEFAHVCVAIDIGTDPVAVSMGTEGVSKDHDWWSYQPRRAYVVGWETPMWTYSQELCRTEKMGWSLPDHRFSYSAVASDLLPPTSFHRYLKEAINHFGKPGPKYRHINEWINGEVREFEALEACTPVLPCEMCLAFNQLSHEGIGHAPYDWYSRKGYRHVPAKTVKEMDAYKKKLKQSLHLVRRAKELKYGEGYHAYKSGKNTAHRGMFRNRRNDERERLKKRKKYGY